MIILQNENVFSIRKERKSSVKDWVLFAIYTVVIYAFICMIFYSLKDRISTQAIIAVTVLFVVFSFLLNRNKLLSKTIEIHRGVDDFFFKDGFHFTSAADVTIILDEYVGEMFVNDVGNLYLRVQARDYLLFISASEKEVEEIKEALEKFFSKQLFIERKKLL